MMLPGAAHTDTETMRRRTRRAMQAIVRFMVETGGSIADAIVARTREPGAAGGRRTRQPTSSTRNCDSRRRPWGMDRKVGLSVLTGIHAALVEGLRNGSLRPVIAQEFPLAEAARSHEAVMERGHQRKDGLFPFFGVGRPPPSASS